MAHTKLSDALYPSLPDRFLEGDAMNWRFAGDNSNLPVKKRNESDNPYVMQVARLFKPSSSIPLKAVNAGKIGAKYGDGILHITLPGRESLDPKPAKEMNTPFSFRRIKCPAFSFNLSAFDRYKNLIP